MQHTVTQKFFPNIFELQTWQLALDNNFAALDSNGSLAALHGQILRCTMWYTIKGIVKSFATTSRSRLIVIISVNIGACRVVTVKPDTNTNVSDSRMTHNRLHRAFDPVDTIFLCLIYDTCQKVYVPAFYTGPDSLSKQPASLTSGDSIEQ